MVKKITKFSLSALLLATSVWAFAEGKSPVVTLKDNSTITWAEFVKAWNNPATVTGTVDPTSAAAVAWTDANTTLTTAKEELKQAKTAQGEAQQTLDDYNDALGVANGKVTSAEERQSTAATELTTAQTNYTNGNNAYNKAIGDLSKAQEEMTTLEKSLATAQASVTDLNNKIKTKYTDVIAAKQATIDANNDTNIPAAKKEAARYKGLMDALTDYAPVDWLVEAETEANAFNKAYEDYMEWRGDHSDDDGNLLENATYDGTTKYIYIQFVTNTKNVKKFNVSFNDYYKNESGWTPLDMEGFRNQYLLNDNLANYGNATTWTVYYYFGPDSNNQMAKISTIKNKTYDELLDLIPPFLSGLETQDGYYQKDKKVVKPGSQALYEQYEGSYNEYSAQVETLTSQNETLQGEIAELEANEKNDPLQTQLTTANNNVTSIEGQIKTLQGKIDGYKATRDKYLATSDDKGNNYIGANNEVVSYLDYLSYLQAQAQAEKTAADEAVTSATKEQTIAQNNVNTATTALNKAKSDVATAQIAVNNAQANVNSANIAYEAAQKEANAAATAAAQDKYTEITLPAASVIDATEPITQNYTGTIYANGSIFNVNITPTEDNTQTSLFKAFSGHVDDAAINGTFASNLLNATFADVARWDGDGKIYNESGTPTEFNSSELEDAFGAFGYALRNNKYYGVNFQTGKIVAATAAPSKVLNLTIYDVPANLESDTPVTSQKYVQLKEKGSTEMVVFADNAAANFALPVNRFAQSATSDAKNLGLTNVYYGTNNTCENVVIVDKITVDGKQASPDFYSPAEIQAENISYDRTFKAGNNTVCLPFTLSYSYSTDISAICNYDQVTPEKFWFTKINETNTLQANTPALLIIKEGSEGVKFENVRATIGKTNAKQLVSDSGNSTDSKSYGTFKQVSRGQFNGESNANFVYGLAGDKFQAAAAGANFPAFRMVVGTVASAASAPSTKSFGGSNFIEERGIGIVDEYGNDITGELVGINDVKADNATAFEVAGGQGEIMFAADHNYGKVEIYSIDGKVAAVANVVEGNTSVRVQKGIYIVNGKKVLVK